MSEETPSLDLSIVIPALNEAENLSTLLPEINKIITAMGIRYEILIVDETADELTCRVASQNNAQLLQPATHGFGLAVIHGLQMAQGAYIVTLDADFSHPPVFLCNLWEAKDTADVIIASRYVRGGKAIMPFSRYFLSRVLNFFFRIGLGIPVLDMSSGYRLYSATAIDTHNLHCTDFDVQEEILVNAFVLGKRIREIPFTYAPRRHGSSHARIFKFGMAYLKTFGRMWRLRYLHH